MEQYELLRHIAETFERLVIAYRVTGSMATIAYGEPRFTNDIDIVVQMKPHQVAALCAAFPQPEYYVSRDAAEQAVRQRFQFNILHPASGLKVDVIIAADSAFEASRFCAAGGSRRPLSTKRGSPRPRTSFSKSWCISERAGPKSTCATSWA